MMDEYFAGGHLRFVNGEWRDDNGDAIEISRVRHGRWIPAVHVGDCCYRCSECQFLRDAYLLDIGNYCPNCGAKMDGCNGNGDICSKTI